MKEIIKNIDDNMIPPQVAYDIIYDLTPYFYKELNIFIWKDTPRPKGKLLEPEPYYKYKTKLTSRPYIPLSVEELNWLLDHKNELEIVSLRSKIKSELKSRNFNAAKQLLPALGKLNKQNYSFLLAKECPNCIFLRLFKIQSKNERSFKNSEPRHNQQI